MAFEKVLGQLQDGEILRKWFDQLLILNHSAGSEPKSGGSKRQKRLTKSDLIVYSDDP
jgi:hypothetical protein